MAAVDITKFFQKAYTKQFARDFLFRVQEIKIAGNNLFKGDDELVYARTGKLPGRTIENKLVNYVGQQFNVPGKSSYDGSESYSIEFYHEESCELRKRFESASRAVFDNETTKGDYRMPGNDDVITLALLDRELNEKTKIRLIGASIRNIGEIQYNFADGTGEVLNFPVTFSYHWYEKANMTA